MLLLLTDQFCSRGSVRALRHVLLTALVVFGSTIPHIAWAQHDHQGGGFGIFNGNPDQVARKVDRLLDHLDATDAQHTQIKQIAQAAAVDLKAQREAGKALHERAMQLFTQASLDADAIEAVRQQMVQHMDQTSKRATQAMLDASRVLTPDQRTKLAKYMKRRLEAMQRRWHEHRPNETP